MPTGQLEVPESIALLKFRKRVIAEVVENCHTRTYEVSLCGSGPKDGPFTTAWYEQLLKTMYNSFYFLLIVFVLSAFPYTPNSKATEAFYCFFAAIRALQASITLPTTPASIKDPLIFGV